MVPVTLGESDNHKDDAIQIKVGATSIEVKSGFNPSLLHLAEIVKVLKTIC